MKFIQKIIHYFTVPRKLYKCGVCGTLYQRGLFQKRLDLCPYHASELKRLEARQS